QRDQRRPYDGRVRVDADDAKAQVLIDYDVAQRDRCPPAAALKASDHELGVAGWVEDVRCRDNDRTRWLETFFRRKLVDELQCDFARRVGSNGQAEATRRVFLGNDDGFQLRQFRLVRFLGRGAVERQWLG